MNTRGTDLLTVPMLAFTLSAGCAEPPADGGELDDDSAEGDTAEADSAEGDTAEGDSASEEPAVPDGCVTSEHSGSLYAYCLDENESWLGAREKCQSFGYDLAIIGDRAENSLIAEDVLAFENVFWIGARDENSEGLYLWWDGTPVVPGDASWVTGAESSPEWYGGCARLETETGSWGPYTCEYSALAMCEK